MDESYLRLTLDQNLAVSRTALQAIKAIAELASWMAKKAGRSEPDAADIRRAMKESVLSVDLKLGAKTRAAMPHALGELGADTFSRSTAPALELVST